MGSTSIIVYEHPAVADPAALPRGFVLKPIGKKMVLGVSHEKLIVVDGKQAFCGGMELMNVYKDSSPKHKGTRHDVHALITGPAVKQFERHFVRHWRQAMTQRRTVKYTPAVKDLPDPRDHFDPDEQRHAVQVASTRSIAAAAIPFYQTKERGIYDAYLDAVSRAKRYIYIENQYFRDKGLAHAIVQRLGAERNLRVILVLPVRPEETKSMATDHAVAVQKETLDVLAAGGKGRIGVFSLRVPNGFIYVHAKVMLVDDKWLTIGTANTDPRSFLIDDEINLVVRDDELAKKLRLRLWEEHFQPNEALRKKLAGDPATFLDLWNNAAKAKKSGKHAPRIELHKALAGQKLPFPELFDQFVWLDVRTGHDRVA